MISEGSRDTEHWTAENSTLQHMNKLNFNIY